MKLVSTANEANFITHAGIFHSDDVMATAVLKHLHGDTMRLYRTYNVPEDFDGIAYDIGGGMYDHHQQGGNGERSNGIKYSSCGLIWRDFGRIILANANVKNVEEAWNNIDQNIIESIDADDNGQDYSTGFTFTRMINNMVPSWDSDESMDSAFIKAVRLADNILTDAINKEISKANAENIVLTALKNANHHTLTLPQYVPWKEAFFKYYNNSQIDIFYVIHPSVRGGYNVVAVPETTHSYTCIRPFPEKIRGRSAEELKEVTNIADLTFVHNAGFIAATETLEGAYKLIKWLD